MITYNIPSPCQHCNDRVLGCHGKCSKYKDYKIYVADENEKYRKQALEYTITSESIKAGFKRKQRLKGGNRS